eukprot:3439103-Pyramimonas_sp.AAC.1
MSGVLFAFVEPFSQAIPQTHRTHAERLTNGVCVANNRRRQVTTYAAKKSKQSKQSKEVPSVNEEASNVKESSKFTRSGRVLVRQEIRYMQLLDAIRAGEVKEMVFAQQGVDRSIAIFKDETLHRTTTGSTPHPALELLRVRITCRAWLATMRCRRHQPCVHGSVDHLPPPPQPPTTF